MSEQKQSTEFYEKLKNQLEETSDWPSEYLYKFIVKSEAKKVGQIEVVFDNMDAKINTLDSKNGKYVSISVKVVLSNPDEVIKKYKEVINKVEGVISL